MSNNSARALNQVMAERIAQLQEAKAAADRRAAEAEKKKAILELLVRAFFVAKIATEEGIDLDAKQVRVSRQHDYYSVVVQIGEWGAVTYRPAVRLLAGGDGIEPAYPGRKSDAWQACHSNSFGRADYRSYNNLIDACLFAAHGTLDVEKLPRPEPEEPEPAAAQPVEEPAIVEETPF